MQHIILWNILRSKTYSEFMENMCRHVMMKFVEYIHTHTDDKAYKICKMFISSEFVLDMTQSILFPKENNVLTLCMVHNLKYHVHIYRLNCDSESTEDKVCEIWLRSKTFKQKLVYRKIVFYNVYFNNDTCCICLDTLNHMNFTLLPACKHILHRSCFQKWKRRTNCCPLCRSTQPIKFVR
jgi:hypothetical protein